MDSIAVPAQRQDERSAPAAHFAVNTLIRVPVLYREAVQVNSRGVARGAQRHPRSVIDLPLHREAMKVVPNHPPKPPMVRSPVRTMSKPNPQPRPL